MKKTTIAAVALASLSTLACSFAIRSPDMYKEDVDKLIAQKDAEVQSCYEGVLKKNKKAAGTVTVKFTVEKKTGNIINPAIDENNTTAGKRVQQCVLTAMEGLTLSPGDQKDGIASYTFNFSSNEPKQL